MSGGEVLALGENFAVRDDGRLTLDGVDLVDLCGEYGTPLFVFDEVALVGSFERFRRAFESVYPRVIVCYSVKTNNNLAVCRALSEKGACAEVSSELDLDVALRAGFPGERIIFDGPFKAREAMRRAIGEKVLLFNVESLAELERLNEVAGEMGVKQAVGLRVNLWRAPRFYDYVHMYRLMESATLNLYSRFGFPLEGAVDAFRRAKELENLSVEGIMTHPYNGAARYLLPMVREISAKLGVELKYLNIGGGFNPGVVRYVRVAELVRDFLRRGMGRRSELSEESHGINIESVAGSIAEEIKRGLGGLPELTLVLEPGRYVSAPSGILLVRVDHVKKAGGFTWVVVDGGTNLVPNSVFGRELRRMVVANRASCAAEERVNVVGPLLYGEDFLALQADLPRVSAGDVLAIFGCGAYTLSMSSQFLHPRPAAVLLNSKREVKVVRERETFEDFVRKDTTL
jgi:diaminopimelate decarboxylase